MKKNNDKPSSARKLGILLLNFTLLYAVLRLIITAGEKFESPMIYYVGTSLYLAFGAGCFVAFFVLNGCTFNREDRTIDDLPDKWSNDKKMEFLRKQPENKAKAQRLIYVILPMLVTLAISYIELNFIK